VGDRLFIRGIDAREKALEESLGFGLDGRKISSVNSELKISMKVSICGG